MRGIIRQALEDGMALRAQCMQTLPGPLAEAAGIIADALAQGGKVLACGNGGSAADAQHFAGELVNRFETNRRGLAAIAMTHDASVITSIANDFSFDQIYARQIEALGRAGDVLLAISTSGNSPNVLRAVEQAQRQSMSVVALTGKHGGSLRNHPAVRVALHIEHPSTPRIQEMHITCLHILCSLIDRLLFGGESS
ncbi:MAG: SIS domain-containing protein [Zetaproteobacteria bacterium]|nr:MAG: SIS domain-containing protein [Zetaproteobacteria bacterium]